MMSGDEDESGDEKILRAAARQGPLESAVEEPERLRALEIELMHAEFRASALAFLVEHEGDTPAYLNFCAGRLLELIKCDQVIYHDSDGKIVIDNSPEIGKDYKLDGKVCQQCNYFNIHSPVYVDGVVEMTDNQKGCNGVPVHKNCPVKSSLTRIIYLDGQTYGYLTIHYIRDYHIFTAYERRTLEEFANLLSLSLSRYAARTKNAELEHELELKRQVAAQKAKLENALQRNAVLNKIIKSAPWSVSFNSKFEIISSELSPELDQVLRNDIKDNSTWIGFIHPEDRERAIAESLAAINDSTGKTEFDSEYRVLSREGRYHWIRSAGRVIPGVDGGEMYGICMDIDETVRRREARQHELEVAVKELENQIKRTEIVVDALHSAHWRFKLSADDRIVDFEYSRDIGKLVKNAKAAENYDWKELVHPDDYDATLVAFNATIKDHSCRTPYDSTFRMRAADGKYNWFRSVGNVFRYEDGSGEFFGIHIDVTERVEIEHATAARNKLLSDVTRTLYGYNTTVNLLDGSLSFIAGTGAEELVGILANAKNYRDAYEIAFKRILPEYQDQVRELLSLDYLRANCKSKGFFGSVIYELNDGRWGEVNVTFGENAEGCPIANLLGRDITEARREAARIEREMKAAVAKDQILSGITKALYGFNITVNLAKDTFTLIKGSGMELACSVFERHQNQCYSDAVDVILSHVHKMSKLSAMQIFGIDMLMTNRGKSGHFDTRQIYWHGSDGNDYWSEINAFMSTNSEGEPIANILGRDITAERNERERIQQLEREAVQAKIAAAEETSRAKTAFLANMSHDIRTPMNAIIGFTDIARKHIHEPEKVDEYLDRVQLAGTNLLEIVDDILDMSKIDTKKVEVTEYPAWISRMPNYFHTLCSIKARERGLTFICEHGEYRDDTVWIDKPHMNRIIINLLSNSIKYTHEGGAIRLCISQLPDRKEGYATFRIVVQDNGIGMSEEYQQHIFERFTRERNSTISGIQGTGIGMAITKSLVDALEGTITVESKENVGTKFTLVFDFRRRRPGEGELEEARDGKVETGKDVSAAQKRILLVEDNEINREIALEILQEQGFIVEYACNGKEAVDKVAAAFDAESPAAPGYDLILMDIMMPVMGGLESTREIRARGVTVPIIALSANAYVEDREASIAAGMNDHLSKPIKVKEFLGMIRKYLG